MPGIVGIVSKRPPSVNEAELERMLGAMEYEEFYSPGCYASQDLGLYAGWVRWADSFSDCLPVLNRHEDVALIFDGENFADISLIDRLNLNGREISNNGSGHLAQLYREQGSEFLSSLNGWFRGVLVDFRANKVVLFNDRFGMQKVFYHESNDAFYFASEAKALLAVRPELREFDAVGLGQHLGINCTLGSRTLFKGISRLPGGAEWTWSGDGTLRRNLYFRSESWENQPILSSQGFYEQFKQTFLQVLPRYFERGRTVMSLTAGLDSRMVLACLNPDPGQLPCFTFGGPKGETLDITRGRETAERCRQVHQIVRLKEDFFSGFTELAQRTVFISDGSLDVCNSHDLYFNRIIRRIAPIRMTGKFGSEIVRNRSVFKPVSFDKKLFDPELAESVDQAAVALKKVRDCHPVTMSVFHELPWNEHGKLAIEQSQLTLRTPYMDNELVRLMYQVPDDVRKSNWTQLRLIEECNPSLRSILTNRGTAGSGGYLSSLPSQLFYYFLLKADYTYLYAMPHWATRTASLLAPLGLERLFLGRQKYEHYRLWLRDQLAPFVKDVLLDNRALQRSFFNPSFIRKIVLRHLAGKANYFAEINKALTLELISRQLLENWPQKPAQKITLRNGALTAT